jgi:hypothetical protein
VLCISFIARAPLVILRNLFQETARLRDSTRCNTSRLSALTVKLLWHSISRALDRIDYPSIVDGMLVHWWANGQTIQAPHVSCATWRRTLGVALTTLDGGRRGWRVEQSCRVIGEPKRMTLPSGLTTAPSC